MADPLRDVVKEAVASTEATSPVAVANAVTAGVKADPIAQNALSQEPWFQSRVANYGAAIVLVSGLKVATAVYTNGANLTAYDPMNLAFDLMILWGSVGVLYGRFVKGLRPMWWRLFGGAP